MKRLSLLATLLAFALWNPLAAQDDTALRPCGSRNGRSAWLIEYQKNPQAHYRSTDTTLYVPLTIHMLGNDDGSGFWKTSALLDALCKLNSDFEEANMKFYIEGEINYLLNSDWNSHETVVEGAEMMFTNNVENNLNCYFANDPAGNCGYNLPYAGVAMAKSCAGVNDDTWAHEVGHNLGLPHPFVGWEDGGASDSTTPHDYNQAAPEYVNWDNTYFRDTFILDTVLIDTVLVERVDGSNCHLAADGFCDTSPDYLSFRWNCDGNSQSPQEQTDPTGAKFRSDGSLIMGYADDNCQTRFTAEQINAMRANLKEEKSSYLYNQTPGPATAVVPPALQAPLEGENVPYDDVLLQWSAVENASQYIVQVSIVPNFSSQLAQEFITEDTLFYLEEDLLPGRTYYWRVRAFNHYTFCTMPSASRTFLPADISKASTIDGLSGMQLYPNPSGQGGAVILELHADTGFEGALQLWSSSGQLIRSTGITVQAGTNRLRQPTASLPKGMYLLRLLSGKGMAVVRFVQQ